MKKDDADSFIQNLLREGWVLNAAGEMSAPGSQRAPIPHASPEARGSRPSAVGLPPAPKKKPPKKGMTDTEKGFYDKFIVPAIATGQVLRCRFESITLRLDKDTTYLPDFQVTLAGGQVEFYEVKGAHVWEDSVIKFKWARTAYPEFKFFMCQLNKEKVWREKQRGKEAPSLVISLPKPPRKKDR